MKFYTSIADIYDQIFPYSPMQKAFVESFTSLEENHRKVGEEAVLLDVGCGTGSLAMNMAESFDTVIAIDPDPEMLHKARLKALKFKADHRDELEELGKWVFVQKGMLDLSSEFADGAFDTVLCFGNTLVHLPSIVQVREFLRQAYEVLKPAGYMMIQIINYDRIIDQELKGLSTIENDSIKFERFYNFSSNPDIVQFKTNLTIKESGEKIENEIPLLALRPQQLMDLLADAGFTNLQKFGNFKKEKFGEESQPFIVVGTKLPSH
ncbi:MAG: class I SAM-dependent methyltransferase [Bacteroidales bacterium]|nr:class I SAM-dependent methyltransferase [Bacteroidales bacterium]